MADEVETPQTTEVVETAGSDAGVENTGTSAPPVASRSGMSSGKVILIIIIGCLLLAVANVSLWASINLFDAQRFGKLVAQGVQSEQVGAMLADEIVGQMLAEYPKILPIVNEPAREIVTALLQRPIFTEIIEDTAAVANVVMTTNVNDAVSIDLEQVVPFVVGVAIAIDPELEEVMAAAKETTAVKLLDPNTLPNLRAMAKTVPWLWPLTLVGAIALFFAAIRWARSQHDAIKWTGAGVLITGMIEILFTPAIRQTVEINITNANARLIVGEVVSMLTRGLLVQCLLLVIIGIVMIALSHYYFKEEQAV